MNHLRPTISDWLDVLAYLVEQSDAPPQARDDAHLAMTTYGRAMKFRDAEHKAMRQAANDYRTALQEIPKYLNNCLHAGTKTNLDKSVEHLNLLEQARESTTQRSEFAQRAFVTIEHECMGGCLRKHRDALIEWIAQRRTQEPTTCGFTKSLPQELATIYYALEVEWSTDWEERLSLAGQRRLPIVYESHWPNEYRASCAWVWEQVANGDYQKVPHPNDRNPQPDARYFAPTRRVVALPSVPNRIEPQARQKTRR